MAKARKNIEIEQFKKLCALQCTQKEIAGFFECSTSSLVRWCEKEQGRTYAEMYEEYSQMGKISLRRAQFKLAEKSAQMAIFMGKNYLGQTDQMIQSWDGEQVQAISRLADVLKCAASRYGAGVASSPSPEQTEGEGLEDDADAADTGSQDFAPTASVNWAEGKNIVILNAPLEPANG